MVNVEQSLVDYKNNVSKAYDHLNHMRNNVCNIISFKEHEGNLESIINKLGSNIESILKDISNNEQYIFERLLDGDYDPNLLNKLKEKKIEMFEKNLFGEDGQEVLEVFNKRIDNDIKERYQKICKHGVPNKSDSNVLKKVIWAKIMDTHDDILYKKQKLTKLLIDFIHAKVDSLDYLNAYT